MTAETAPRFAGIGGHHSHKSGTVEWLTPPSVIAALGPFDLDPCAPEQQPYPTAAEVYTRRENGLLQAWSWNALDASGSQECTCGRLTGELRDRIWSKPTETAFRPSTGDASNAERLSHSTAGTSAEGMPESISQAGAENVAARGPRLNPGGDGLKIRPPRLNQRTATAPQKRDARRSAASRSSTITGGASGTPTDLFDGPPTTGEPAWRHGTIGAPIATTPADSRKTTSCPSTIQISPAQSPATCSPPASPAIHQSKIGTRSTGSGTPSALNGLCSFCWRLARRSQSGKPRIFLNPPYSSSEIEKWLARMAEHDRGTALVFARTETDAFFRYVWERATALLFMRGRINFHFGEAFTDKRGRRYEVGERAPGNAGAPTVLCAYGADDAAVLAGCSIDGRFVPLRIPRSVVVSLFAASNEGEKIDMSWSEALAMFMGERPGPVALDELYRHFSTHRKARGNRHFDAKLRQQLQRGPYRRVGPGLWENAHAQT